MNEVQHAAITIDPKLSILTTVLRWDRYEVYFGETTQQDLPLDETLNNYGNPYFDECDITFD